MAETAERTKRIQLFRNTEPSESLAVLLDSWKKTEFLNKFKDGEQVIGRYKKTITSDTGQETKVELHTVYGIAHIMYTQSEGGVPQIDTKSYIEVFKPSAEASATVKLPTVEDNAEDGQYVSSVSQTNGEITVSRVDLPIKTVSGFKETENTPEVVTGTYLDEHKQLVVQHHPVESKDGTIKIESTAETSWNINLQTKVSTDSNVLHVAKDKSGLYTNLGVKKTVNTNDTTYQLVDYFKGPDGEQVGEAIVIPNDKNLNSVKLVLQAPLDEGGHIIDITTENDTEPTSEMEFVPPVNSWIAGQYLRFEYILADGKHKWVYLDVSTFLVQAEFKDGLQVNPEGTVQAKLNAKGGLMFDTTSPEDTNKSIQINNDKKSILVNSENGQVEVGTVDCGEY